MILAAGMIFSAFRSSPYIHLQPLPPSSSELIFADTTKRGKTDTPSSITPASVRKQHRGSKRSFDAEHPSGNNGSLWAMKALQEEYNECPPNIDFEKGDLTKWQSNIGHVLYSTPSNNIVTYTLPNWLDNQGLYDRHVVMDRQSNPPQDNYGNFPVNPPIGGGRYSLKLGTDKHDPESRDSFPNALAEAVRYVIKVPNPATNFAIVFSYAVVFENPSHPDNIHTYTQQPRFMARMYEPGGDTLKCVNLTFVASDPLPGFDTSTITKVDSSRGRYPGGLNYAIVKFKKWSSVFVDLSDHPGKTFYLEFVTTDCTKKGHFGYGYVDVMECNNPTLAYNNCREPIKSILTAPPGFESYEWWNADFTKILGTSETLTIDPPIKKDEFIHVKVNPFDRFGCVDTFTTQLKVPNVPIPGIRYPVVNTSPLLKTPLNARPIGTTYRWNPAKWLNDYNTMNPLFSSKENMEYTITIGREPDCITVDTVEVRVTNPADIWVPKAFTPDDDGRNDQLQFFTVGIREIRFWVFNRWGQLMFETKDPHQRWDGKFNGHKQPLETYVWIAEGITTKGEKITRRGQTILIR